MENIETVSSHVYKTLDWDKFKFNKLNRPVDEGRVEYWKKVLSSEDLLCDNPFLVDAEFNIIDGQHRLLAAKALGIPVYFMIADKARIEDAPGINSQNRIWTSLDYLSVWCNANNKHYLKARAILEIYPFMKINVIARLMYRGSVTDFGTQWARGLFVVRDEQFVHVVAQCALDFKRFGSYWKDYTFINAIANLCDNKSYDHARMMRKMEMVSTRLKRCTTAKEYIEVMNGIYNYKTKEDALVPLRLLEARSSDRYTKSAG